MTNEYRLTQLAEAEQLYTAAKEAYASAKTKKARRRAAAEDIEFFGSKVAFLSNPNIER